MRSYKLWLVSSKYIAPYLMAIGFVAQSYGAVNIDRTRLVFRAGETAQSLNLSNDGDMPAMVQIWTDTGDPHVQPDNVSTPIIVTPPVFKILPQEIRSLRLLLTTRNGLPSDRESMFWLNIFQILPDSEQSQQFRQKVVLPLRLRMKVFIRPAGLGAPDSEQYQRLVFRAQDTQLNITNPTAWYMSFSIQLPGQRPINNLMVAPISTISLESPTRIYAGQSLWYGVITDDGNSVEYQASVTN